jgi:hypothetical protein
VQNIRFSRAVGAQRGWVAANSLGMSVQGPQALVSTLELQLGLAPATASMPERVVQMRECLAQEAKGRFYEKSFEADQIGTAETLLGWRDLWHEHGWTGGFGSGASSRLQDMAAVEALAATRVSPSIGQRLSQIALRLAVRKPQIEAIELLEPVTELPMRWQQVLSKLKVVQLPALAGQAPAGTVLYDLQAALRELSQGKAPQTISRRDDGTVRLVRSDSKLAAAAWLANEIVLNGCARSVVVAEQEGAALDAALVAAGGAQLGFSEPSAFRPALQLLPLILRLLWEPLDLYALTQFATLPIGPISRFARREIAQKLSEAPGVSGQKWTDLLKAVEAHHGDELAPAVLKEIAFWVEHQRFDPEQGAPLSDVYDRVDRLSSFFSARLMDDDPARRASWLAGLEQSEAMLKTLTSLDSQGVKLIKEELLERLVVQVASAGASDPTMTARVGAGAAVTDPQALIEEFDAVYWYQMEAVPLPRRHPWTSPELQALRQSGADLPDVATLLKRQAASWTRPVFAAKKTLTLMLPPEAQESHPFWTTLKPLFEEWDIAQLLDVLKSQPAPGTSIVPHKQLPRQRRWWSLQPGSITWTGDNSYSSLEKLIFDPHQWVLQYPAKLRSSALMDLPGDFRLLGNLAHCVVERLYKNADALSWNEAAVLAWFDATLPAVVAEEGAVLLMKGKVAEFESFRLRLRPAIARLHEHLQASNAVRISTEVDLEVTLSRGRIKSRADLMMERSDGHHAVVDLKWAGDKKYRAKLQDGTHVQLAVYAKLAHARDGRWPSVAYFILVSGQLFTSSGDVFLNADPVRGGNVSTRELWGQVELAWEWRHKQIEAGQIEVVAEHLEDDPNIAPPDGAVALEPLDWRYNPYVYLTGWKE